MKKKGEACSHKKIAFNSYCHHKIRGMGEDVKFMDASVREDCELIGDKTYGSIIYYP